MRKTLLLALAVGLGAGASPAAAAWNDFGNWNWCTPNSLSVCMNFELQQSSTSSTSYQLTATYLSTSIGQDGLLTGVGLYRMANGPDVSVSDVTVQSPGSWTVGTGGLGGGGNILFEVAANSANGAVDGVPMGGSVVIQFTSSSGEALNSLYAQSHIQSLGVNNCSLKPDSRIGVVDGAAAVDERCGTVTPEPMSMVLLGTGLLGIGGVGMRRRRRHDDPGKQA